MKQPGVSEVLSAKRATAPGEGDLPVVERLVNEGKLIVIHGAEHLIEYVVEDRF